MENCCASCAAIKRRLARGPEGLCIVGYGNPGRRDDGAGPWVVERLRRLDPPASEVSLLTRQELEPDLIDEMSRAGVVILVDASVERLEGGISWAPVDPAKWRAPFLSHSMDPAFLLNLVGAVHQRLPAAWLVSIQGEEFGLGQGLSGPTEDRARKVAADLVKIIAEEGKP